MQEGRAERLNDGSVMRIFISDGTRGGKMMFGGLFTSRVPQVSPAHAPLLN